ncbi:hypothetical protein [Streptomyces sp. FZ201]|uniref:hypothetical protein n=1 Tax=Streptomyces sp. FZ201 TaxID=3057122 RepID=UPI0021C1A128|nr:hypothetical protein [Streptomyces sp. FZ201]
MSLAEQRITAVMRQVSSQEIVALSHPFARIRTVAALAYIAEAYGFRYADTRVVGNEMCVYLVRDRADRVRQRATANAAAFPQAGAGGPVPGMRRGTLTPLPDAEPEVAVLKALIRYDAYGGLNRKLTQAFAVVSAAVLLLLCLATGEYLVLMPPTVLIPGFVLVSLRVGSVRRARLATKLTAAGCTPVRDQQGRDRFVRPVPNDV